MGNFIKIKKYKKYNNESQNQINTQTLLNDYEDTFKHIHKGTFNYNKNNDHLTITLERLTLRIDELEINGKNIYTIIQNQIQNQIQNKNN